VPAIDDLVRNLATACRADVECANSRACVRPVVWPFPCSATCRVVRDRPSNQRPAVHAARRTRGWSGRGSPQRLSARWRRRRQAHGQRAV